MKKLLGLLALATFTQLSHADDWGCQVLLCLSDPRGPRTESECRPPIDRLFNEMRKRHFKFPTCDTASSSNGQSFARMGSDYYDPCPQGYQLIPLENDNGRPAGGICRGAVIGYQSGGEGEQIPVYDDKPASFHANPTYFDIYIDNKPYQRVRPWSNQQVYKF